MPKVDLNLPEPDEFELLPPGRYNIEVYEIRDTEKPDKHGNEMWLMQLKIIDGEFRGRMLFDRLIFGKGQLVQRISSILRKLGFDPSHGIIDLQPKDLLRKRASVDVEHNTYLIYESEGNPPVKRTNNRIKFFGGWHALGDLQVETDVKDELPF